MNLSLLLNITTRAVARIRTGWFGYSLASALKRRYHAALRDPRNKRMVLMSEQDVPLLPPAVFYLQLLASNKSLVGTEMEPLRFLKGDG